LAQAVSGIVLFDLAAHHPVGMKRVPRHHDLCTFTQLHGAVVAGCDEAIRFLIESGATVDQRDEFGNTPLHKAAWLRQINTVKLLVAHGADLGAKQKDRLTPLDLVTKSHAEKPNGLPDKLSSPGGHSEVEDFLLEQMKTTDVLVTLQDWAMHQGGSVYACVSIKEKGVMKVEVDPVHTRLWHFRAALSEKLRVAQQKVQLMTADGHILQDADDLTLMAELLAQSEAGLAGQSEGDKLSALNALSCSSTASVSTCASCTDVLMSLKCDLGGHQLGQFTRSVN